MIISKNAFKDWILFFAFVLVFPFTVFLGLYYPNVILEQGLSHRIFYFHVPVAWAALYAPIFASIFGILFLYKKDLKYDTLSYSMSKLALFFAVLVIYSGRTWAKSAWGVPWDWSDARLQSFFMLFINLISYLVVRSLIQDINKKAKVSSILAIASSINSVITWEAIRLIDNPGNHPSSVLGKGGMDPDMRITFWISVIAYHILFLVLFLIIYRYDKTKEYVERLKSNS
ncbi:MAG: cytochrome c biogenesis protein CcsA [Leptospiraceae bacterium]|nr:cytochrome c biogenesis protein CcsA [Leptospiraceae bacterium]